jgi:hypothetical protein
MSDLKWNASNTSFVRQNVIYFSEFFPEKTFESLENAEKKSLKKLFSTFASSFQLLKTLENFKNSSSKYK